MLSVLTIQVAKKKLSGCSAYSLRCAILVPVVGYRACAQTLYLQPKGLWRLEFPKIVRAGLESRRV